MTVQPETDDVDALEIERGQTWRCNEARADPDAVADPHSDALWDDHPRFTALVDDVSGGIVTLTVTHGNDHPRAPDFGATVVKSTVKLRERPRWRPTEDSR
ncbi:hypothetical protein [Natrinema pallidum]|nr:hypothetical protein [Natrinema pallidum]